MIAWMSQTTAGARFAETTQTLIDWTLARATARAERQNALFVAPFHDRTALTPATMVQTAAHMMEAAGLDMTDLVQGAILTTYGVTALIGPIPEGGTKAVSTPGAGTMTRWQALGVDAVSFWTGAYRRTDPSLQPIPAPKIKTSKAKPKLTVVEAEQDAPPALETTVIDLMPEPMAPEPVAAEAVALEPMAPAVATPEPVSVATPIPPQLDAARNGQPDDLKVIKGIGARMEELLNALGIYHYDQIANWTPEQVSWIESKIDFRGRVTREGWVAQAQSRLG
jgi:predicted flap endonuclease-1-like 5' DNA nuclease